MKRLNVHIVIVLLLIFILPLSYQSYHIIHHHAAKDLKKHDEFCCLISEANCKETFSFSEKKEDCAVCDYEFTTYDFPEAQLTFTVLSDVSITTKQFIQNRDLGFCGNDIALRGPPSTS